MNRRRVRTGALVVGLGALILGGVLFWALPVLVRRVALGQLVERTGRAAAIESVAVNVFTGRLRFAGLRLAERQGPEAFVELERLDARLVLTALLRAEIRLAELTLVAPSGRMVRTASGEFNFSDILSHVAAARASRGASPDRWTVAIDRLTITKGAVRVRDETLAPVAEWWVHALEAELGEITTHPGAAPGHGMARALIDEARLDVTGERLTLSPLGAVVTLVLDGFALHRLGPYLASASTPYRITGGRLGATLTAVVDHEGEKLTKAALSGRVRVEGETLARADRDEAFLDISRIDLDLKDADAITRSLTIGRVAVESATLRARREPGGVIDLVDMLSAARPAVAVPASSTASLPPPAVRRLPAALRALAYGFAQIVVERITLGPSTVTLVDHAIRPTTTLTLTGLQATVSDFTWPATRPASLALATGLPGGGTLEVTGPVRPQPLEAELASVMRGAPVRPYQAYLPGRPRVRGRFSGDSRTRVAGRDGQLQLASKGRGWAEGVEIGVQGADRPTLRVERMDLVGIDVDWPHHARVARAGFRRPRAEVVREADGSFDVQRLFVAPGTRPTRRAASPRGERPKDLLDTIRLDFKEIRVEDGFVRFLDRTTTPAFSKDFSQLSVTVDRLGNRPGRRAGLAVESVVGGDSTLQAQGELGAIGSPVFVDVTGEVRHLSLASFNPYAEARLGWVIKQGELEHTVRFTLDGSALEADNDIVVGQLRVAPSRGADEVRQQIGLPLGLIVALAKDRQGEIRASIPVSGSINDPAFNFRGLLWTAVRQSVARIVRAPFRTISRSLSRSSSGGEPVAEPTVDPVTFAAGSAVIGPDMEQHLLRVADFLRRSPFVNIVLTSEPGADDVQALTPTAALVDLERRRLDATRERLVSVEGIPAGRLEIGVTRPAGASGSADTAGRVELAVIAGSD